MKGTTTSMNRASYPRHNMEDIFFVKELFQCRNTSDERKDTNDDNDDGMNASMELAYALLKEDILSPDQAAPPSCATKKCAERSRFGKEEFDTRAVLDKALDGISGADRKLAMALMEQDLLEHDRSVAAGDETKVARRAGW